MSRNSAATSSMSSSKNTEELTLPCTRTRGGASGAPASRTKVCRREVGTRREVIVMGGILSAPLRGVTDPPAAVLRVCSGKNPWRGARAGPYPRRRDQLLDGAPCPGTWHGG